MFTTPAFDPVPIAELLGLRRRLRALAQPRIEQAGVRRRAADVGVRRGDRDAGHGQIRALITSRRQSGAVVAGWPAARATRSKHLDFMVSIDPYLNETTRLAHVILPPAVAARALALRCRVLRARGAQRREVLAAGVRAPRRRRVTIGRSCAALCDAHARCRVRSAGSHSARSASSDPRRSLELGLRVRSVGDAHGSRRADAREAARGAARHRSRCADAAVAGAHRTSRSQGPARAEDLPRRPAAARSAVPIAGRTGS